MQKHQLEHFKEWYRQYSAKFLAGDVFVDTNLKLKEEHTWRVCEEMNYLTGQLGLDASQRLLAEATALFHDVGRYEQFSRYRTFSDAASTPHGPLGVEVLNSHKVLDVLDDRSAAVIRQAVELHAVKKLPDNLDDEVALLARLIRDADKLDIYYLVTEVDTRPPDDPQASVMINWFPPGKGYSQEMIEAVLARRHIDYAMLKTNVDMKLMQLAWVYDLNFPPTFARLKSRRYLEKIVAMLPATGDIERVARQVLAYRDKRLNGEAAE